MNNEEIIGIDLKGRVNSLKLAERNNLLPLMEAIVNSIHAIEDANIINGEIDIHIHRDNELILEDDGERGLPAINGFTIIDNGIGFNEENYNSFKRAFSTHKADRGGKGLGRFLWLKAYAHAQIESVFLDGEKSIQRKFKFTLNKPNGIDQSEPIQTKEFETSYTQVDLVSFKEPFRSKCPKKADTIANRIIEHCLVYFLNKGNTIQIILKDGGTTINLNERFNDLVAGKIYFNDFKVGEKLFNIKLLKWFEHEELTNHRLSFCANQREVESFPISKIIPEIQGKIFDEESGKYFLIVGYIESEYFDNNVNDERTEIRFKKKGLFDDELFDEAEILSGLVPVISKHFGQIVKQYRERKAHRISSYVQEEAPQYFILNKYPELLENIVVTETTTNQELDLKLYRLLQQIDFDSRKEVGEMLDFDFFDSGGLDSLHEKYTEVLNKLTELNKSKLAQYVVHRKYIIELFEKSLELNQKGKYELEKTVHDIVFPTKSTSIDVLSDDQNLWLIDERLSFHTFLSSDKPLNTIEGLETESIDRPDLLIFNNPLAFVEGDNKPYNSIVLVEFKRPMRSNYSTENDNPINQLYGYIRKIREGKQYKQNGRNYEINEHTWFYAYLVCDANDKIDEIAQNANLEKTYDGLGYYGYNKGIKCMVEIVTFDQIISNAKKRNNVLFHKLGI